MELKGINKIWLLSRANKSFELHRKLIAILVMAAIIFSVWGITSVPVRAATIIVAAANSTNTWKSEATAVCTGTTDQNIINSYLTSGATVELSPGTYNCNGMIILQSNTTLYGQGDATIINLGPNYNGNIQISNVSNVNVGDLEIEGTLYNAAVQITSTASQSNFDIYNVECEGPLHGGCCFSVNTSGTISNVIFSGDDANSPDGNGFMLMGGTVSNVTFYDDTVENAGIASTRANNYVTGFDLADVGTFNNIYVIDCSVNNSWESCFHMEYESPKNDVVITGCSAIGAADRNTAYTYGYGYLLSGDTVEYGNTASDDAGGVLNLDGNIYTSMVNGISPVSSAKTATSILEGNCAGTMIDLDSTHKELVLYSNDGNPVSQQIELGGNYTSCDGNTYSFSGTDVLAQFTNYAVMNLVASSISINNSSLPNGIIGQPYSQTLTVNGGSSPYEWTISSGILPTGLSLSNNGLISGVPTEVSGPTSVDFQATDITGLKVTKCLSISVVYAIGDVNMDGSVNVLDMILISNDFGQTGTHGWIREDVNNDGFVNVLDLITTAQHFTAQ